jgi:hypothetical protein
MIRRMPTSVMARPRGRPRTAEGPPRTPRAHDLRRATRVASGRLRGVPAHDVSKDVGLGDHKARFGACRSVEVARTSQVGHQLYAAPAPEGLRNADVHPLKMDPAFSLDRAPARARSTTIRSRGCVRSRLWSVSTRVGRDAPGALRHFLDQVVARKALQAGLVGRDDIPRLRPSPLDRDRHVTEVSQMGGRAMDATVGGGLPLNHAVGAGDPWLRLTGEANRGALL